MEARRGREPELIKSVMVLEMVAWCSSVGSWSRGK